MSNTFMSYAPIVLVPERSKSNKNLPLWIRYLPDEIHDIVEQEFYVNPELARYFAENARTYEDIQMIRRGIYESESIRVGSSHNTDSLGVYGH